MDGLLMHLNKWIRRKDNSVPNGEKGQGITYIEKNAAQEGMAWHHVNIMRCHEFVLEKFAMPRKPSSLLSAPLTETLAHGQTSYSHEHREAWIMF